MEIEILEAGPRRYVIADAVTTETLCVIETDRPDVLAAIVRALREARCTVAGALVDEVSSRP